MKQRRPPRLLEPDKPLTSPGALWALSLFVLAVLLVRLLWYVMLEW